MSIPTAITPLTIIVRGFAFYAILAERIIMNAERLPSPEVDTDRIQFGFYWPKVVLENDEIERWNATTASGKPLTAEKIEEITGILRRYVAGPHETAFFMGGVAALHANGHQKVDNIFVTTTYGTNENIAKHISDDLGLDAEPLDVYEACAGFAGTLSYIKQNEGKFQNKDILIVSTDTHQANVFDLKKDEGQKDPALSQTIFSDGATAIKFKYGRDLRILAARDDELGFAEAIKLDAKDQDRVQPYIVKPAAGIPISESGLIEQDGKTVFKAVSRKIPHLILQAIQEANLKAKDVKFVIPHQPSIRVLQRLQDELSDQKLEVAFDITDGNFSSASIPKAMATMMQSDDLRKGDIAVLAGFGAGLFASVAVVQF